MRPPICSCLEYIGDDRACPIHNAVCLKCNKTYVLGVNGTVYGCDICLGLVRNDEGLIIPNYATIEKGYSHVHRR